MHEIDARNRCVDPTSAKWPDETEVRWNRAAFDLVKQTWRSEEGERLMPFPVSSLEHFKRILDE
jgi:hypothetical protein